LVRSLRGKKKNKGGRRIQGSPNGGLRKGSKIHFTPNRGPGHGGTSLRKRNQNQLERLRERGKKDAPSTEANLRHRGGEGGKGAGRSQFLVLFMAGGRGEAGKKDAVIRGRRKERGRPARQGGIYLEGVKNKKKKTRQGKI